MKWKKEKIDIGVGMMNSDYARGEEISELGRKLMSEALDKYHTVSS